MKKRYYVFYQDPKSGKRLRVISRNRSQLWVYASGKGGAVEKARELINFNPRYMFYRDVLGRLSVELED